MSGCGIATQSHQQDLYALRPAKLINDTFVSEFLTRIQTKFNGAPYDRAENA